jgi:catechol 2,3-dioxygenase-like lactoylglutathione lyase family enzyme
LTQYEHHDYEVDMNAKVSLSNPPIQHRNPAFKYRGIHHLVLNTDDIKMTIDFYSGVLGMPLVHAMKLPPGLGTGPKNRGNPPFENIRHYFFDMGNDSLLAFFELPKGAKESVDRDGVAAMQHVAFSLRASQVEELVRRLDAASIDRIGPLEAAPGVWSCYFMDPSGIRLEVSYQPSDGEDQQIYEAFIQTKEKMLAELRTVTDDQEWLEWASSAAR